MTYLPYLLYLAVGVLLYTGFGLWAYARNKSHTSDAFFVEAVDFLGLAIWPIILPILIIRTLREKEKPPEAPKANTPVSNLIGKQAFSVSDLRPSGTVIIGNASYTAISADGFIESETEVTIVCQDSLRLKVCRSAS